MSAEALHAKLPVRDGDGAVLSWPPLRYAEEARRAAVTDDEGNPRACIPSAEEGYVVLEPERITDEEFELLERQLATALDRLMAARLRRMA